MKKLTDKQERFCLEYVKDFNATQAAIRAGYSERTAYSIGQENLKKPEIQNFINSFKKQVAEEVGVTFAELVIELKKLMYANVRDFLNDDFTFKQLDEITPDQATAISSITVEEFQGGKDGRAKSKKVKFSMYNKLDAIEKLAKHTGFYGADNAQKQPIITYASNDPDPDR